MTKRKPKYHDWCSNCLISPTEHAEMHTEIAAVRKQLAEVKEYLDTAWKDIRRLAKNPEAQIATAEATGRREAIHDVRLELRNIALGTAGITWKQFYDVFRRLAEQDEPCKTCGGSGEIPRPFRQTGYSLGESAIKTPCPDCGKPDKEMRGG